MKQLVLHGPATLSSRGKLVDLKQKFDTNNIVVFEKGSDLKDVLSSLMTPSILSEEQLIIWENPPSDFIPNSSLITNNSSLILWFDREIDPKKYPKAEILFFPEAKEISVFPFLDLLGNKDKKAFLEMQKLKGVGLDIQYLITMVFYLLRSLIVTAKNAPPFVVKKNEKMRANFSSEELINLYKSVLEIDFKIKSGLLETTQAEFSLTYRFIA